jgi:hypothetical protein
MSRIIFDFKCPRHGVFEGSHAICPQMGCDSEGVEKIFVKAPSFRSDTTKRTDAGLRKSAEMYNQSNWKTAKAGELSKANNRADELLWGDAGAAMVGRKDVDAIAGAGFKSDGAPALGMVQEKGPSLMQRTERTGMKKQDDAWRQELVSVATPKK